MVGGGGGGLPESVRSVGKVIWERGEEAGHLVQTSAARGRLDPTPPVNKCMGTSLVQT